ncbi:Uncharacterised protein [Mycobacteroides abscessus subsp. abscessus]|nr:Uncharacterised protein [Mycobacteroides abscessus subsp. abscessus]
MSASISTPVGPLVFAVASMVTALSVKPNSTVTEDSAS